MLNWFPTHGTSLYMNNTLISGDNKGYAAVRFEKHLRDTGNSTIRRTIVTGFSQANVGDVSPNTLGPVCQDTGLPCKYEDSTCDGRAQQCHARGPGFQESDVESCRIIGEKQFSAAQKIYKDILNGGGEPVVGSIVKGVHTFVDFGQEGGYKFKDLNGVDRRTCKAALGFGFAGGTTDGPGYFDFTQNEYSSPKSELSTLNIILTATQPRHAKEPDMAPSPQSSQHALPRPSPMPQAQTYPPQCRRNKPSLRLVPQHCRHPASPSRTTYYDNLLWRSQHHGWSTLEVRNFFRTPKGKERGRTRSMGSYRWTSEYVCALYCHSGGVCCAEV